MTYPEGNSNLLLSSGQDLPGLAAAFQGPNQYILQISKFSPYRARLPPAVLLPTPGSRWKQRLTQASIHTCKYFWYFLVLI